MTRRDKGSSPLVPRVAASRLSRYLRHLEELEARGESTTSSQQLGGALGVTAAQVRKDLGYFGQFGFPGLGYKIPNLIPDIRRVLGMERTWNVALVGIGNLGNALLRYKGFQAHGFRLVALFDASPRIVGRTIEGMKVHAVEQAARVVEEKGVELAILAVPASAAQEVASRLVAAGIRGIYNFAPVNLSLPEHVAYVSIDLSLELEQLAFLVSHRNRELAHRSSQETAGSGP
ncbi:MAG: redox-sensing transcriptional repressor Rex [Planctomycetes bacterium]|nr:redox-sensing transcriptional repressor Rex [Planctomycetota bacterium]